MRHMKLVEQAVCVGFSCLHYVLIVGCYSTVGIVSAPVEFQLLFDIIVVAIAYVRKIAVSFPRA